MKYIKKGEVVEAIRITDCGEGNYKVGNWIVKGEYGQTCVCENEEFEKMYIRCPENHIEKIEVEYLELTERVLELIDLLKLKKEEEYTPETIKTITDLTIELEYMERYRDKLLGRYYKEKGMQKWDCEIGKTKGEKV